MTIFKQHIYLPKKNFDMSKWAVIACDQFTSEPDYWSRVKNYVSGSPSTYDLIFPEIYLTKDNTEMIKKINKNMQEYNEKNILEDSSCSMILVNRSTQNHKKRLGIVMNIDVEDYDYRPNTDAVIKATEGTILERIPPRVEIRKDAIYELTHIMLLYDDRDQNIAENLYKNKENLEKVYDFNLNMEGGHIEGYKIKNCDEIIEKFNSLLTPEYLQKTFNSDKKILFAVGDGNHSLAVAKEHWNRIKGSLSEEERKCHPARYALVEAVNIHDEGIEFSPIYRVVTNASKGFLKKLKKIGKSYKKTGAMTEKLIYKDGEEDYELPNNSPLAIKLVQDLIDEELQKNLEMEVDYVHGLESLKEVVSKKENAVGITLPTINKNELFEFVLKYGVLPRKSFSIGEAREKRYYLEAHKIRVV